MSFKVADTGGRGLGQLVADLHLDQTGSQGKELRSKGKDLYVKDSVAVFTDLKSRAAHRDNAVGSVKQALMHEYGLTVDQATRVMARVLGATPTQISGGQAFRLHEVGQLAQKLIDQGVPPVRAFAQAADAHALVKLGADETLALQCSSFFPAVALLKALREGDLAEFGRQVERLPDNAACATALTLLEDGLLAKADRNDLSPPVLTKPSHEIIFRKKTDAFEQEIRRIVDSSHSHALKGLQGLPETEYWKLLIDGGVHAQGNKHAYDRSLGFMASMMKGLEKVVREIDQPLDSAYVKALHECATRNVTNEQAVNIAPTSALSTTNFQETGVKRDPNAWGVCKTFSEQGMTELAALRQELDLQVGGGYFGDGDLRFTSVPDRVVQWKAGNLLNKLPATGTPTPQHMDQARQRMATEVTQLMDYVINKANAEIAQAHGDTDAILGAIVDCCRGLSIIHPFKDANGRLMNFLVLNKLLLQNGMSPTILADQGLMVGRSKAELIELIKQGQAEVHQLKS